jgi:hypothetical protein
MLISNLHTAHSLTSWLKLLTSQTETAFLLILLTSQADQARYLNEPSQTELASSPHESYFQQIRLRG